MLTQPLSMLEHPLPSQPPPRAALNAYLLATSIFEPRHWPGQFSHDRDVFTLLSTQPCALRSRPYPLPLVAPPGLALPCLSSASGRAACPQFSCRLEAVPKTHKNRTPARPLPTRRVPPFLQPMMPTPLAPPGQLQPPARQHCYKPALRPQILCPDANRIPHAQASAAHASASCACGTLWPFRGTTQAPVRDGSCVRGRFWAHCWRAVRGCSPLWRGFGGSRGVGAGLPWMPAGCRCVASRAPQQLAGGSPPPRPTARRSLKPSTPLSLCDAPSGQRAPEWTARPG